MVYCGRLGRHCRAPQKAVALIVVEKPWRQQCVPGEIGMLMAGTSTGRVVLMRLLDVRVMAFQRRNELYEQRRVEKERAMKANGGAGGQTPSGGAAASAMSASGGGGGGTGAGGDGAESDCADDFGHEVGSLAVQGAERGQCAHRHRSCQQAGWPLVIDFAGSYQRRYVACMRKQISVGKLPNGEWEPVRVYTRCKITGLDETRLRASYIAAVQKNGFPLALRFATHIAYGCILRPTAATHSAPQLATG